ncbi:MAG: periplasmic heavy metal sensor [Acidobacteria bacterium]|nr:periplasmic heavy metal sensor [Acidobacteriota bacterium]
MSKKLAIGVLILSVVLGVLLAAPRRPTAGTVALDAWHHPSPVEVFADLLRRLELTDEQKEAARAVIRTHRDALEEAADLNRAAHDQLRDLVRASSEDGAARAAAEQAHVDAEVNLARERAGLWVDLAPILTVEQYGVLAAFREERFSGARQRIAVVSVRLGSETTGPFHAVMARLAADWLGITTEQSAAIRAAVQRHAPAIEAQLMDVLNAHEELFAAIQGPGGSEAAAVGAAGMVARAENRLAATIGVLYADVMQELNGPQRLLVKLFGERRDERQARRREAVRTIMHELF